VDLALKQHLANSPERDKDWIWNSAFNTKGKTVEVAYGNPWEKRTRDSCTVFILEDGHLRDLRIFDSLGDAVIVEGCMRRIYFPPLPYGGKSSLMGDRPFH